MLERFTRDARRVVEEAVEVARREGAAEIRPEHVFAGLLADDDALAVQVLAGLGAAAEELRQVARGLRRTYVAGLDAEDAEALKVLGIDLDEVVRRIDTELGGDPARRGHIRFAKASKRCLALALREAVRLGDGFIGTEHLLLGMVRSGDRVVLGTLAAFDIGAADLRAAVEAEDRRTG